MGGRRYRKTGREVSKESKETSEVEVVEALERTEPQNGAQLTRKA
jgi:hypothetical protein